MTAPEAPRLPKYQPQECRTRAEDRLIRDGEAAPAAVWALLAIAGELHEIRRLLSKRR